MVLTSLLLGTTLVHARQNPNPANVRLPEGWTIDYWGKTKSKRGGIKGPGGQEIGFPDYGSSGRIADSIAVMHRDNILHRLILGGRAIDVALTVEGLLVVSYPPAQTHVHPGDEGFDYWSTVRSPREVAQVFAIVLTRVEEMAKEYKRPVPSASAGLRASDPASPFPGIDARYPVPERDPSTSAIARAPFDGVFREGVTRQRGVSAPLRWTVRETILNGALTVSEARDGRLIASYAWADLPSEPRFAVSFVGTDATPRTAVDAVVAAITYREPPKSSEDGPSR